MALAVVKSDVDVPRISLDCTCDGTRSWCVVCLIQMAIGMRRLHRDTLSVGMLKRRMPGISGREAAILIEFTRRFEEAYN